MNQSKATPWVVIDATDQVLRCNGCGATHPLDDGVNGRPVWFACAVMNGFTKEHENCAGEIPMPTPSDDPGTAKGDEAEALAAFWKRWHADGAENMTKEQWGDWVEALPREEFIAMIGIGSKNAD